MRWESSIPAVEPITVADAKTHLHIDGTAHDAWLTANIPAVREYAESAMNRSLISRSNTATFYPGEIGNVFGIWPTGNMLPLPRGPVSAINSVADRDGATLGVSLYELRRVGTVDHLLIATTPASGLVVNYTAGYGTNGAAVPAKIKTAMLMHLGTLFVQREATSDRGTKLVEAGLAAIYGQEQAGGLL